MNHRALLPYLAGNKHTDNGEGNGTPLQYSCLENPMDGGAWWAAVHGVTKNQTQLSDFTFTFHLPLTTRCQYHTPRNVTTKTDSRCYQMFLGSGVGGQICPQLRDTVA